MFSCELSVAQYSTSFLFLQLIKAIRLTDHRQPANKKFESKLFASSMSSGMIAISVKREQDSEKLRLCEAESFQLGFDDLRV